MIDYGHGSQRHWRNRRRMAWSAVIGALVYPALVLATDSATLGSIAGPYYVFAGLVAGAYIGAATYDDAQARRQ